MSPEALPITATPVPQSANGDAAEFIVRGLRPGEEGRVPNPISVSGSRTKQSNWTHVWFLLGGRDARSWFPTSGDPDAVRRSRDSICRFRAAFHRSVVQFRNPERNRLYWA